MRQNNGYRRGVGYAKIIMPVAALALMSTMFLLAQNPTSEAVWTEALGAETGDEPLMTHPTSSSISDNGTAVEMSARTLRPHGDGSVLERFTGRFTTPNGTIIDATSRMAQTSGGQEYTLTQDVVVTTSDGYRMVSDMLIANTQTAQLSSPDEVVTTAPFGTLTAGSMVINANNDPTRQLMVFGQGVHLLYNAKPSKE